MRKKPAVIHYFSSVRLSNQLLSEKELKRYFAIKRIPRITPNYKTQKVLDVQVSQHAADRWNERVGPVVTKLELEDLIGSLMNQLGRIAYLSLELGLIDRDIFFTYQKEGQTVAITTFYGRSTEQPILNNFAALRKYNLLEREQVDLSLSESRLQAQMIPPIPRQTIVCKGRRNQYHLEEYSTLEGSYLTIEVKERLSGKRRKWSFLLDDQPHAVFMNKSIQHALCLMGFETWVQQFAHLSWEFAEVS